MNHSTNGLASPIRKLLPLLTGVIENGQGRWKACCPIHEADGQSHSPSLEITETPDGTLLLHCFPCGPDVRAARFCHAVGLTESDLYAGRTRGPNSGGRGGGKKRTGKKVAEYVYRDAQGCIAYRAERWQQADGSKTFVQSRPNGEGGWVPGVKGIERVPYRLPELIASAASGETVFIVEGEKKAEALVKWGLIATCNVGGAGKWAKEFSTRWLRGRDVVILPDNDPLDPETGRSPGFDHAAKVLESTKPVAKSVRVIELPGLPPKGDIIDWIDQGGTLSKLMELLKDSSVDAVGDLEKAIEQKKEEAAVVAMEPLDLRLQESLTDIGNGRRITKRFSGSMKYCHQWGSWLIWDGRRWCSDSRGTTERNAKLCVDEIWKECQRLNGDVSDNQRAKMVAFAKYSSHGGAVGRMLSCARSEEGMIVNHEQLDKQPWLLNVANGTLDLQNGELKTHDPDDYLTKVSPTVFDPNATCPGWEKFLLGVFGDRPLVDYVQRLCGYWATGIVREALLPILWGEGSNGKTTFINAIKDVLGEDYFMTAVSDFLMIKKFDGHPTEKADLFGKRIVSCSETESNERISEKLVKQLTGNESIRARRMNEDFWQFDPTHKLILSTNHRPVIRGTDNAIWRRIRLIPFTRVFWADGDEEGPPEMKADSSIAGTLKEERSGILTWIAKGAISWFLDGEQTPEIVKVQTSSYRQSQDLIANFLAEVCDTGPDETHNIKCGDLYAVYQDWEKRNGEKYNLTQRQFGMAMTEKRFRRWESSGMWYLGVQVRDQETHDSAVRKREENRYR